MAEVKEYEIKVSTADAQKAVKELNEQLKIQGDVVLDLQEELVRLERELDKVEGNSGKAIAQRKIINDQIKKTKAELKGETLAQKRLNKEKKDFTDVIKSNTAATKTATKESADFSGALGFIDSKTGGAVTAIKKLILSLGNAKKSFNGVKVAIASTGIGALVIAVGALAAAFTRSEEGQEKFQRIMAKVGAVTNQVLDAFANLGEALLKPEESLKKLANGFIEFAKKPLPFLIDGFKKAGKAASDFVEETSKEIDVIDKITKKRQKAHHIERELETERANADREINELRLQAEDRQSNTATERIALLRKAQAIEEEITAKEIKAKQLLVDALTKENELGKSTIADKDKLAKLQGELIDLDTKKLRSQRLLQTQITTAINEEKREKEKAVKEAEAERQKDADKEIEDAEKLAALKKQIRDKEAVTEDEERALRLTKIKEEYDELIRLAKAAGLVTTELEAAKNTAVFNAQSEFDKIDRDRADKVTNENIKRTEKEADAEEKRKNEIISYRNESFDNAARIAGEETKLGKALLLAKQLLLARDFIMSTKAAIKNATLAASNATVKGAEATTEVAGSVAKAANTAPPPINIPFILSAIATGLGIVSSVSSAVKATKQASNAAGGSGGGGVIGSSSIASVTPSTPSAPPAFNIVGATGTNQLASAIGSQNQRPIRTYVVAGDVSTAQSLDRNIITGASLGG
tara:strand:+ start:1020 stop:3113 length:2094 start_codon:yes stop_codon:yes gene_type:complete